MRASLVRLSTAVLFTAALITAGLVSAGSAARAEESSATETDRLVTEFRRYSGAQLVFEAGQLPPGEYYDIMPELSEGERLAAAKIACREVQKYPPQYLAALKFRSIGIFQACASQSNDNFHPYDKALGGYRYFGLYNGRDAIVAAYYTDSQLPLTLHHEIFHHVDRNTPGTLEWSEVISEPNRSALSTEATHPSGRYHAIEVAPSERILLERQSAGRLLNTVVSNYAAKNPTEDKAETARYLLSALADSLLQMAQQPQLPGSQRLLHVLTTYERSNSGNGPKPEWFLAIVKGADRLSAVPSEKLDSEALILMLWLRRLAEQRTPDKLHHERAQIDREQVAEALSHAESLIPRLVEPAQTDELIQLFAALQLKSLRDRIQPAGQFVVRGQEDAQGINGTLRDDVASFAAAAERVGRLTSWGSGSTESRATTQIESIRLIDRYYRFIAVHWKITAGTRQVFQHTCDRIAATLPPEQAALAVRIMQSSLEEREVSLTDDGRWSPPPAAAPAALIKQLPNDYLDKVDDDVRTPATRAAIRRVQPACVRISNGSGVNVSPYGCVLTAAHVAEGRGRRFTVIFPDGERFSATCIAIDAKLDLALCQLSTDRQLPFAQLALRPPKSGSAVVCIGQPGETTPDGEPTKYEPFHVSTGQICGFLEDPLGPQALGRTKHDAWTYWGHSGSPLFDEQGEIVALHNSWDPETAMRHAVTQQAIAAFLAGNLSQVSGE